MEIPWRNTSNHMWNFVFSGSGFVPLTLSICKYTNIQAGNAVGASMQKPQFSGWVVDLRSHPSDGHQLWVEANRERLALCDRVRGSVIQEELRVELQYRSAGSIPPVGNGRDATLVPSSTQTKVVSVGWHLEDKPGAGETSASEENEKTVMEVTMIMVELMINF